MLTTAQQGALLCCLNLADGPGGQSPSSLLQGGVPESSEDEFGILEDDRCIDTGVFQPRYLVHELVFACSPRPPPRPNVSHTILTQASWCSTRAVARCETGLLPVIQTVETGFSSVLPLTGNQDTVLRLRYPWMQNKFARMMVVSRHNISLSPQQPSSSSTEPERSELADHSHAMEKKQVLDGRYIMPPGLQSHSPVRQRTGSRFSRGTDPPRRGIQRGRQTVSTEILVAGDHVRPQSVRRGLSRLARPAGESSVQVRLARAEFQRQNA